MTFPEWLPLIFELKRRKRCPSSARLGCSPCVKAISLHFKLIVMLSSCLYFSLTSSRKAAHLTYLFLKTMVVRTEYSTLSGSYLVYIGISQRGIEVESFINTHIVLWSLNVRMTNVDLSTVLMMKVKMIDGMISPLCAHQNRELICYVIVFFSAVNV